MRRNNGLVEAPLVTRPTYLRSPFGVSPGFSGSRLKRLESSIKELVCLFCPAGVLRIGLPDAVCWPP
jgi:hypothetical protein